MLHSFISKVIQEHKPSDIHIKSNKTIFLRVKLELKPLKPKIFSKEDIIEWLKTQLHEKDLHRFLSSNTDVDFSATFNKQFTRINAFHSINGIGLAIRILNGPRKIQELDLTAPFLELFHKKSGLIIFSGPTGSGKSTCVFSIITTLKDQINRHLISIEDPIEYVFDDDQILFLQREVGRDVPSMLDGITSALRQDPDIIFVGEIRSISEIKAALTAAETGHLVITTLHSENFVNTLHRIIDVFPSEQQPQIVNQLSQSLLGVCSLRLVQDSKKNIRSASEIAIITQALKSVIISKNFHQANNYIQTGRKEGMRLLQDHINVVTKQ